MKLENSMKTKVCRLYREKKNVDDIEDSEHREVCILIPYMHFFQQVMFSGLQGKIKL